MWDLLSYEKELFNKGYKYIAGVDEVGRGPLAGPFVVGAVILNLEKIFSLNATNNDVINVYKAINDSKKLSEKKRGELNDFIKNEAISYSVVEINSNELDKIGISKATQVLFYNAIFTLQVKAEFVLTDSFEIKKLTKENQINIIHGDSKSISIAAASIIAKVHRDREMSKFHEIYPQYGFDKHKGYGTKLHLENLNKYGPCEIHRKSFEPVHSYFA